MSQSSVRAKRVYEPPADSDGHRVLATRYWPRGVSKDSVGEYVIDLSPSRELLHQFRDGQLDWRAFRNQYLKEMGSETAQREIHRLAKLARDEPVTVMCVCADENRCHRSLLRDLIEGFDKN